MVLVMALFTMAALLVAATAALLVGASDVRATRNYRGAAQVHFVAESAILDAMQTVNGPGTVNFQNEIVEQLERALGQHVAQLRRSAASRTTWPSTAGQTPPTTAASSRPPTGPRG